MKMLAALPVVALLVAFTWLRAEPPVVIDGMFYAHVTGENGQPVARPARIVPLRVGQCYGWVLRVEPEEMAVTIREVFDLPGRGNWNTAGQASAVSRNARTAVTQFEAPLNRGVITHGWCVAAGDPAGPHRIRVYHGERLLREFRFTVALVTQ